MPNIIHKLILQSCPDYDFGRYHFKLGDVVDTLDGAKIFVIDSALDYVEAFILKSSFTLRRHTKCYVPYSNLPDFKKGEFVSEELHIATSLKWQVGNVVMDPQFNNKLLLTEENEKNTFIGVILESEVPQYVGYSVVVQNPYRDYLLN